ncbi:MAG: ATP-binding cassette domain-containing protein, partial [Alphaproteobacteria bacterium]
MLLELKAVSKSFGSLVVADAIDLQVGRGDALGIIGPNGAGKTTLFNLITGGLKPDAGSVWFDGRDVTAVPAQQRCFAGMGRSFQVPLPFEGLSVFENVAVGGTFGQGKSVAQVQNECLDILALTGLLDKANVLAGQLTLLERKRLEM